VVLPDDEEILRDRSISVEASRHDQIIFWHRELPPLDAEVVAEHTVEAASGRVAGTLSHRDDLWDRCYQELMSNANARLTQEIVRLGGHYAHVYDESIEPRHDDAAGQAWLQGCFSYVLYRKGRPG
jgi:hypothetical protein